MIALSTARFIDYDASKYNYFQESLCRTDECVATAINQHTWSPCVWADGKRKKKNFLYADLVAFDIHVLGLIQRMEQAALDVLFNKDGAMCNC